MKPHCQIASRRSPPGATASCTASAPAALGGDILKEANLSEFLRDLTDIARAELEPGRDADAGEADFIELFEFVRAGAQLSFDELAQARAHAQG